MFAAQRLAYQGADPWLITACNMSARFFVHVQIPTWWSTVAEISGRHGAAMWGLMNSGGGLILMATSPLFGWLVDSRTKQDLPAVECWQPTFWIVAGLLTLGGVCWLFVDPTSSIVSGQKSELDADPASDSGQ